MKLFNKIILVLLVLLSLSSGIAKVMQVPADVAFFQQAGLSIELLILLGGLQLLGGILLLLPRTRKAGAAVMIITFLISTVVIFINGKLVFGIFSLLPVIMAILVIRGSSEATTENSQGTITSGDG